LRSRCASPAAWTAFDELHPQTDAIVAAIGAEHDHDVRMPDARQPPRLADEPPARRLRVGAIDLQQLQRDLSLQFRIPGAIHFGRSAFTDAIEQDQPAPFRTTVRVGFRVAGVGDRLGQTSIELRDV